ncbi:MAG: hypothetical protein ABW199_05420 [Caulobacterales bacterium]
MLTFVDSISLAGDRTKQNDDAYGHSGARAWVIDGATDLHDAPLTGYASDASWMAQRANTFFHAVDGDMRALFREASAEARDFFNASDMLERWKLPTAAVLMITETDFGVSGLDLGDARCCAIDAKGEVYQRGGPPLAADNETKAAAAQAAKAGSTPLLKHESTLDYLRAGREKHNEPGSYSIFGLQPECADLAREWEIRISRPAHILLMTDGFSALVDRYAAYDAAGLMRAALDKGLAELTRELRAIETQDSNGAQHPRWKRSDDATAMLLFLS